MNRKLKQAVFNWLRLQREGHDQGAEKALDTVFSMLPREPVPDGFSERVLARLRISVALVSRPVWQPNWVLRWVLCSCLLLGAWLSWILPELLPSILRFADPLRLAELWIGALVGTARRFGEGMIVWRALSELSSKLASALSSPQSLVVLSFAALLSIAAFRTLHGLLASERSTRYVGSV